MSSRSYTAAFRSPRILSVALSALLFVLLAATCVRAQGNADAEFLSKVVPSIAASVKIIDYAMTNASNEKVKEFAGRVLKQHKESVGIASEHAKRLNVAVVTDSDKDSKEIMDK